MEKVLGPNIHSPKYLGETMRDVFNGISRLFEITKEYDLKPISENGETRIYFEEDGKYGFQSSGQFERPIEFLQSLLDMIRVQYEPQPMGTFFLNANIGFLQEAMHDEPFQLAYASLVSRPDQSFASFYEHDVLQHLETCGYDVEEITAMFAVASTGHERYKLQFVRDINGALNSGFSVDECLGQMAASIEPSKDRPRKQTYSGYCLDPALGTQIRISLWCYANSRKAGLQ